MKLELMYLPENGHRDVLSTGAYVILVARKEGQPCGPHAFDLEPGDGVAFKIVGGVLVQDVLKRDVQGKK